MKMTKTALELNEQALKGKEIAETKRHNQEMERQGRAHNVISAVGTGVGAATGTLSSFSPGRVIAAKIGYANKKPGEGVWRYKSNPIELYTKLGNTAFKAGCTIPTYFDLGTAVPFDLPSGGTSDRVLVNQVQALYWIPSIGKVANANTNSQRPINVGLNKAMATLRSLNSRIGQYEPGDLGQVLICTGEVFSAIEDAKRAISCANVIERERSDLNRDIICACGYDCNDLLNNKKRYIQRLNILIDRANTNLVLPVDFAFSTRHIYLNKFIIADKDAVNSQFMVFKQAGYWQYDEANALCKFEPIGGGIPESTNYTTVVDLPSLDILLNMIDAMITNLTYSAVLVTMYADLLAAIGNNKYKAEYIDSDSKPEMVTSSEYGDQIRNAFIPVIDWEGESFAINNDINQDSDGLLESGTSVAGEAGFIQIHKSLGVTNIMQFNSASLINAFRKQNLFLNVDDKNKSDAGIMEATRLHCEFYVDYTTAEGGSGYDLTFYAACCGSEIPIALIGVKTAGGTLYLINHAGSAVGPLAGAPGSIARRLRDNAYFGAFGYAPIYYTHGMKSPATVTPASPSWDYKEMEVITDFHNPIAVPYENFDYLHRMALTSEFAILDSISGASKAR